MSFADPQTLTVNAVAQTLPRISSGNKVSEYREDVGEFALKISHQEGVRGRNKRLVRVDQVKVAADPFVPAQNQEFKLNAFLVIDAPVTGYTAAEIEDLVLGLVGWLTSANVLKVIGGES